MTATSTVAILPIKTPLAFTSAGRRSPLEPRGIGHFFRKKKRQQGVLRRARLPQKLVDAEFLHASLSKGMP
jgi:hypothetical protein